MNARKWKRLLSLMLTLCMVLSWNVPAYAADETQVTPDECPGHKFTVVHKVMKEPTCTVDGAAQYECELCGFFDATNQDCYGKIIAPGHDEVVNVDKAATCKEEGSATVTCKNCDLNESRTLPTTDHTAPEAGTPKEEITPATCDKPKQMGYKCTVCDQPIEESLEDDGEALGHDFETGSELAEVVPATCVSVAKMARVCANAGCTEKDPVEANWTDKEDGTVDATNHAFGEEKALITAATCKDPAQWAIQCTREGCDAIEEGSTESRGEANGQHTYAENDTGTTVPPNCAHGSYLTKHCTTCNQDIQQGPENNDRDENSHTWATGDKVLVEEANCNQGAVWGFPCTNDECDAYNKTEGQWEIKGEKDPANHVWGELEEIEPTCTENGKEVRKCQYHKDVTDPESERDLFEDGDLSQKAKGHTPVVIEAVPGNCQTPGKTEGKKCSVCNEVLEAPEDTEIDESTHVYPEEADSKFREETCAKNGLGKFICTVCKKKSIYQSIPAAHDYEEKIIKDATCTEDGQKVLTCQRGEKCDKEEDRVKNEVITSLGHTWGNYVVNKKATCTEKGEKTRTCEVCQGTETKEVEMVEHKWEESIKHATCTSPSKKGTVCSVCNTQKPGTELIDMQPDEAGYEAVTAHTYQEDTEQSIAATCTEDGTKVEICTVCNDKKETPVDAKGHNFKLDSQSKIEFMLKEATCTENGKYIKTCLNEGCGEVDATEEETDALIEAGETAPGAASGHTPVEREEVPATCKAPGTEAGEQCETCEKVLSGMNPIAIDTVNGHDWEVTPFRPATCTSNGLGKYVCRLCGESKYQNIPAEHSWNGGTQTTAPTCTEPGEKSYTCTVEGCDGSKTEEVKALGHDYSGNPVVTNATCGKDGSKVWTCQRDNCEETKTTPIPASGLHTYAYIVIPADCYNPKRVGRACSVCHLADGEPVVVTGEADQITELTAAFIESNGWTEEEQEQNPAAAAIAEFMDAIATAEDTLGHTRQEVVKVPATCTAAGEKEVTCSKDCGYKETEVIEALGHEWGEEYIAPTCTESGKMIPKCTRDGCEETGEAQDLGEMDPPTGHNLKLVTPALKPASCTSTGLGKYECQNVVEDEEGQEQPCGYSEYSVIPITHDYNEGTTTKEPTCTENGETTYTCKICEDGVEGHTKTEPIAATGHEFGEFGVIEATCITPASIGRQCSVCQELTDSMEITDEDMDTIVATILEKTGLTEDDPGFAEIVAKLQEAPAKGHSWTRNEGETGSVSKQPTCTVEGVRTFNCTENGCNGTKTEVIEATGHTLKNEYVAATCLEGGKNNITCEACDYEDTDDLSAYDPALGHDPVEIAAVPATCQTGGKTAGEKCNRCQEVLTAPTDTDADPVNGHQWNEGTESGENICENGGSITKDCTVEGCNESVTDTVEPGHAWEVQEFYEDEQQEILVAIIKVCKRQSCNKSEPLLLLNGGAFCKEHGLLEADEIEVVAGKPATCTEAGKEDTKICKQCKTAGEEGIVQGGEPIEALGHTFLEWVTKKPATCKETGSKVAKCKTCQLEYGDPVEIEKSTEHDYQDVLVDPTCKDNAKVEHRCSVCEQLDPDHPYDEIPGSIDESAHQFNGTVCTVCGKEMPEGYAECTEHGWVKGLVVKGTPATCTQKGKEDSLKCPECDEVIKEGAEINEIDHTFKEWKIITAPTCGEPGSQQAVCAVCNQQYGETEEIPATEEHQFKEEIVDETCISNAKVYMRCSVCQQLQSETPEEIPDTMDPDAHTFGEDQVCEHCHKTAEEAGFYACVTHGLVKAVVIPGIAPTCTTEGKSDGMKCPACGTVLKEQTTLAKADHTFGEWVTIKDATCAHKGTKKAKCEVCNQQYGEIEEIPATGIHAYTITRVAVAATCTENAWNGKFCDCGAEDETQRTEVEDTAKGHDFSEGDICKNGCGTKNASTVTGGESKEQDGNKKVTFTSEVVVSDKEAEIVEMGILYITASTYAPDNVASDMRIQLDSATGDFTIAHGSVKAKRYVASESLDLSNYTGAVVTINLGAAESTANDNRRIYARGYVIIRKNGVCTVQYSDSITSGTYADGFTAN